MDDFKRAWDFEKAWEKHVVSSSGGIVQDGMLKGLCKVMFDGGAERIAELEQCCTQRGARMQLMKEFMEKSIDYVTGEYVWEAFCHVNPEHADWFDDDGFPK